MEMEELISFAKRTAMFWPSADIYGGSAGLYDYGHVGTLLKKRFESVWSAFFVDASDYYFIEGTTILPDKPLVASGHAAMFNDILINCSKCKTYYRADVVLAEQNVKISDGASAEEINRLVKENPVKCPKCKGEFAEAKPFNMMFDLGLGPEKLEKGYLRPETAQSVYLNFYREFSILRRALPLGLAIIGRAYRNEISPRQGLYRMRELTQAELQIFFDPETWKVDISKFGDRKINLLMHDKDKIESLSVKEIIEKYEVPEFYAYHMALIDIFYIDVLKVPRDKFRFREKFGTEKAFYNKVHMDIEVKVESWGDFKEVGGLHYRTDYDLTSHTKGSKQDLSVKMDNKRFTPHVLELSFGVDRNIWMLLDVFYKKIEDRSILSIQPYLAPFVCGIFSLQKDEKLDELTSSIHKKLKSLFRVFRDDSGSIGRRYARQDEIGTPFCITVDYESVDKASNEYGTVTVRYRDDKKQVRLKVDEIDGFMRKEIAFDPAKFVLVP